MTTFGEDYAHPCEGEDWREQGLTKREYFAAAAMQGILSRAMELETYGYYAKCAVVQAEALIAALNEETESC